MVTRKHNTLLTRNKKYVQTLAISTAGAILISCSNVRAGIWVVYNIFWAGLIGCWISCSNIVAGLVIISMLEPDWSVIKLVVLILSLDQAVPLHSVDHT